MKVQEEPGIKVGQKQMDIYKVFGNGFSELNHSM